MNSFAIPIITRFVSDFLGFFDSVKTVKHPNRPYSESQIYQHISNCQDYLSYASDETTAWKRRQDFKKSIAFLSELTKNGTPDTGLFNRALSLFKAVEVEDKPIMDLRAYGADCSAVLMRELNDADQVTAAKMVVALNAAHKAVLMVRMSFSSRY